jgi:3-oxoacyl-[acyl-carrier-protein] synthase-3
VDDMTRTWMLTERGPRDGGPVARFESIGVKLPERRLATKELMASAIHRPDIDLERLTGIRERRICGEGENSFTLALDAARDALARSRHRAEDLDMLLCASITRSIGETPYRFEPPLAVSLREALGARRAVAFDLSNACAGMMTGVLVLADFIRRGAIQRGMVVSGEAISGLGTTAARAIRTIYSRQLASLTLGDAGAAVIVERAPADAAGILIAGFTTISEHSRLCLGMPLPHAPGARMFTRARTIHRVALEDAPPLLEQVLGEVGLGIGDIDWLIPHQTSARAIASGERELRARFGVGPKHVVVNVEDFGNTASTTHFIALRRWLDEGRMSRGEKVMLLSLASGLEIGIVVFELDDLVNGHGNAH